MKTREEILKKYDQMLKHTEQVTSNIENEKDLTNHQIEVMICEQNTQHQMNDLMRWVLNIKQ